MAVHRWDDDELIDFAGAGPSRGFAPFARLEAGGVTLTRGQLAVNDGNTLGAARLTVAVIENEAIEIEWQSGGQAQRRCLLPTMAQILPAGRVCHSRWTARPTILAVGFDDALIKRLRLETGLCEEVPVGLRLGLRDPEIDAIIARLRLELDLGGWSGRFHLESLGVVLAVYLLRRYAGGGPVRVARAGLSDRRLRRVVGFIEAHLGEDISQAQLADIAALSPHHFASAFRRSAGVAPHRYLMERRIARACERLVGADESITTIAHALGFSSHGHFSESFRRMVGVTPSGYRRHSC